MKLGDVILIARRQKKMTQDDLAEACDSNRASVSLWESNARMPSLVSFCKLTHALELSDESILKALEEVRCTK